MARDTALQTRRWGDRNSSKAIIVLHGFGADNGDLVPIAGELDPENEWDWHFLRAPVPLTVGGANYGRAWFPDTEADLHIALTGSYFSNLAGIDPDGLRLSSRQVIEYVRESCSPQGSILIGGFSQGAMVSLECCIDPGFTPAGLFMLSGGLIAADRTRRQAAAKPGLRFFQSHGIQDSILDHSSARALYDVLSESNWRGEFLSFDDGHTVALELFGPLRRFLEGG